MKCEVCKADSMTSEPYDEAEEEIKVNGEKVQVGWHCFEKLVEASS